MAAGVYFNLRSFSIFSALAERSSGYAASTRGPPSSSSTRLLRGIDVAEVVGHVLLGDVADGAGQFHAGGAAADHHKIQRRMPAVLHACAVRPVQRPAAPGGEFRSRLRSTSVQARTEPTLRARNRSGWPRWPAPGSHRRSARRFPGSPGASLRIDAHHFVHQHFGIRSACAECCGSAARCRPATAPPAPPGRAAAERCDDSSGRSRSHPQADCPGPWRREARRSLRPRSRPAAGCAGVFSAVQSVGSRFASSTIEDARDCRMVTAGFNRNRHRREQTNLIEAAPAPPHDFSSNCRNPD